MAEWVSRIVEPRTLVVGVIGPAVTIGFIAALLTILEAAAERRGASLRRDLGARGWSIALLVVGSASLLSGVVVNALLIPSFVPVDWIPLLVSGPILAGLGVASFVLAWREIRRASLPVDRPVAQKG